MSSNKTGLSDEVKSELAQAAEDVEEQKEKQRIEEQRSETKYGDGVPDGHREDDEDE